MKIKIFVFLLLSSFLFSSIASAECDFTKIQSDWLSWTNYERTQKGIEPLVLNDKLSSTALDWSIASRSKGYIDHKRPGQKAYYDYKKIGNWFNAKGLQFKNINRVTFSESIGWNTYSCKTADCTQNISDAVKKTFFMYMREKGKKYAPHYNSLMNKNFRQVGIGLVLDESKRKYYITIHYGTEVVIKE